MGSEESSEVISFVRGGSAGGGDLLDGTGHVTIEMEKHAFILHNVEASKVICREFFWKSRNIFNDCTIPEACGTPMVTPSSVLLLAVAVKHTESSF